MDIGSAGAIASFAYTQALRSGSDQAQALQQAFAAASTTATNESSLFAPSAGDPALLNASFQGALNSAGYALAQLTGQGQDFTQGLLASLRPASSISALGTGVNGGLEALNPQMSGALAAYEYQLAVNNNIQQSYLMQLMGSNGLNLLS
jgi:hypothetical protein